MNEHVFSTLLDLKSAIKGELAHEFYYRVRRKLYVHLSNLFPLPDSRDKSFATFLRAYFDVDRDGKRLIIGWLGDHLPMLGTAKNS